VGAVMADILPYLEVRRSYGPEDAAGREIVIEDMSGLTLKEAEKRLKAQGISAQSIGAGETVTAQIPAAGSTVPGNSQILLYLGEEPEIRQVTVPDFKGMNRQQASDAAGQLGLYVLVTGNTALDALVTAQSEAKNTKVPVGTTIRLEFADLKAAD